MDWHDRVEVRAELRTTYTNQWVSYIFRPQGYTADPGEGDRWSDQWEYLRGLFVAACKSAIEAGMGASDIAKDAGADDVREIVMDLNEAGMKLPWPDSWPGFDDSFEATEVRNTLRQYMRTMRDMEFALPFETETSPEAVQRREHFAGIVALFRDELRKAATMGIAVEPIITAARSTYDEMLPHLLAIGYTQTYEKVDFKHHTTISLTEPPEMCPQCLTAVEHCSCGEG